MLSSVMMSRRMFLTMSARMSSATGSIAAESVITFSFPFLTASWTSGALITTTVSAPAEDVSSARVLRSSVRVLIGSQKDLRPTHVESTVLWLHLVVWMARSVLVPFALKNACSACCLYAGPVVASSVNQ